MKKEITIWTKANGWEEFVTISKPDVKVVEKEQKTREQEKMTTWKSKHDWTQDKMDVADEWELIESGIMPDDQELIDFCSCTKDAWCGCITGRFFFGKQKV